MKRSWPYLIGWLIWVMFQPLPCRGQYDFIEFIAKENGLPADKIADAVSDSKGYLWLGTAQGLFRFDGQQFERFPLIAGKDSVSLRNIFKIAIDQDDKIYCSFTNNGFGVFDPNTLTLDHYLADPGNQRALPSNTIDLVVDAENLVFLTLESNGFAVFNKTEKNFRHVLPGRLTESGKHPHANDLLTCTKDKIQPSRLWITCSEGLYLFNTETNDLRFFSKDKIPFPFHSARCAYFHTDGRLYIGTWWGGILVFNTMTMQWEERFLTDKDQQFDLATASAIARGPGEEIWVHSKHGLLALRPQDKKCHLQIPLRDKTAPFESEQFWSLRASVDQIIPMLDGSFAMIGSGMEGLHIYHPNQQQVRKFKTGTVIHYTAFAKDGTTYLTTNEPVFFIKPPGAGKLKKIPIELLDGDLGIRGCFLDKQQRFWLAGEKSLYRYQPGDLSAKPVHFKGIDSLVANGRWVISAFLDSREQLWVGSNRQLMVLDDLARQDYRIASFSDSLSGSLISWRQFAGFEETGQNRVWFACDRGFGYSDDGGKSFFRYGMDTKTDQPFEFADFNSFALDKMGRLWAGSAGDGLVYLNPGQPHPQVIQVFRGKTSRNLIDQVKTVKNDVEGNIWALSTSGLFKIDPADLSVSHFGRAYGLLPAQLLTMGSLPDDGFLLGTLDGYYAIEPSELLPDRRFPNMEVLSWSYFTNIDQEIVFRSPENICLKYPNRSFQVNFGVPWFWASDQIQFQYRLTGYHQSWVQLGNERSIFLGEIPPGGYTLEWRASNAAGEWSESNIASLLVEITPAFWETGWFRLLALTVVIGAAFWLFFIRKIRQSRERVLKAEYEQQLSRLELSALRAQMNPHFIFNAFNSVKWYLIKGEREKTVDYLDKFSLLIRKVLESTKNELVPLSEEIETITLMLEIEQIRFKNKFEYHIEVDEKIDTHFFRLPPLILQPYVENAIWHGLLHKTDGPGRLTICLTSIPGGIQCIIEDNGIGREKAKTLRSRSFKHTQSYGMQIGRERIALLSAQYFQTATLEVEDLKDESGEASGTRVTATLCP